MKNRPSKILLLSARVEVLNGVRQRALEGLEQQKQSTTDSDCCWSQAGREIDNLKQELREIESGLACPETQQLLRNELTNTKNKVIILTINTNLVGNFIVKN